MTIKLMRHGLAAAALLGLLAACGGGTEGGEAAVTEVPASAGATPEAYVQYIAAMKATDYAEPLGTDAVDPPKVDYVEPLAVD